jgi:hypothetical protein
LAFVSVSKELRAFSLSVCRSELMDFLVSSEYSADEEEGEAECGAAAEGEVVPVVVLGGKDGL